MNVSFERRFHPIQISYLIMDRDSVRLLVNLSLSDAFLLAG